MGMVACNSKIRMIAVLLMEQIFAATVVVAKVEMLIAVWSALNEAATIGCDTCQHYLLSD